MAESIFTKLAPERQLNVFRTIQEGIESDPPRPKATFANVCMAYAAEQFLLDAGREGRLDHEKVKTLQRHLDEAGGVLFHGLSSQGPHSVADFREDTFGRIERMLAPDVQAAALIALNATIKQKPPRSIDDLFASVRQFLAPTLSHSSSGASVLSELDPPMQRRLFDTLSEGATDSRGLLTQSSVVAALVAERAVVQSARLGQLQEGQLIDLEGSIDAAGGEISPGLRSKGPGSVAMFRLSTLGWITENLPVRVQPAALWTLNALLAHRAPADLGEVFSAVTEFIEPLQRQSPFRVLSLERQIRVFETLRESFHSRPALHRHRFSENFAAVVRVFELEQFVVSAPVRGHSFVEAIQDLHKSLEATEFLLATDEEAASADSIRSFCSGPLDRIATVLQPERAQACFAALNARLAAAQPAISGTREMLSTAISFLAPILKSLDLLADRPAPDQAQLFSASEGQKAAPTSVQSAPAPIPVFSPEPVAAPDPVVVLDPEPVLHPVVVSDPGVAEQPAVDADPLDTSEPISDPAPSPAFSAPSLKDRVVATIEAAETPVVRIDEPSSQAIEVPLREVSAAAPLSSPPLAEEPDEILAETIIPDSKPESDPASRLETGSSLGLIDDFSGGSLQADRRTAEADIEADELTKEAAEPPRRRFRIRFNILFLLLLPAGGLAAFQVSQQLSRGPQKPVLSEDVADFPLAPARPVAQAGSGQIPSALLSPGADSVSAQTLDTPPPPPLDDSLELLTTPLPELPTPIAMPTFIAPQRSEVTARSSSAAPLTPSPAALDAPAPTAPPAATPASVAKPVAPPAKAQASAPSPALEVATLDSRPASVPDPQTVEMSLDPKGRISVGGDLADPAVRRLAQQWVQQQSLPPVGLEAMAISRLYPPSKSPSVGPQPQTPGAAAGVDPYAELPMALREPLRKQVQSLLVSERMDQRIRVLPASRVTLPSPLGKSPKVETIPLVMFTDGQIVLLTPPSDVRLMASIQDWADAQPLPPKGFVTPMVLSFQPKA